MQCTMQLVLKIGRDVVVSGRLAPVVAKAHERRAGWVTEVLLAIVSRHCGGLPASVMGLLRRVSAGGNRASLFGPVSHKVKLIFLRRGRHVIRGGIGQRSVIIIGVERLGHDWVSRFCGIGGPLASSVPEEQANYARNGHHSHGNGDCYCNFGSSLQTRRSRRVRRGVFGSCRRCRRGRRVGDCFPDPGDRHDLGDCGRAMRSAIGRSSGSGRHNGGHVLRRRVLLRRTGTRGRSDHA